MFLKTSNLLEYIQSLKDGKRQVDHVGPKAGLALPAGIPGWVSNKRTTEGPVTTAGVVFCIANFELIFNWLTAASRIGDLGARDSAFKWVGYMN